MFYETHSRSVLKLATGSLCKTFYLHISGFACYQCNTTITNSFTLKASFITLSCTPSTEHDASCQILCILYDPIYLHQLSYLFLK